MAESGPVVTNSGPLIALASVGQLDLLSALYTTILVPEAVWREVTEAGAGRPGARELLATSWTTRVPLDPPPDRLLTEELGAGEAEAIALAVQREAQLLLMDDRRARRVAELAYRLRVKGAAGILVAAKRRGLIAAVRPLFELMRVHGYYLSPRLIERACHEAGET
jgi:predicted nucleic acid-binding protein